MTDPEMDAFLMRAVLAATGMQENHAGPSALYAFHYAVGLALMGEWKEGVDVPIPQITKNGLDALHLKAHALVDNGFEMGRYSTKEIAAMHLACLAGIEHMKEEW